jgi:hypothetical protein
MTQWLSPRWNTRLRFLPLALLVAVAAVGVLVLRLQYSPLGSGENVVVPQPVWFTHNRHVGQLQLDCRYCHTSVEDSALAGLPSTSVCMNCHSNIWKGHPELEAIRASYEQRSPMAWRRVHDLPDHCYFNHSIHVQKGIGCVTCHGRMDKMTVAVQRESLHMEWCLECHRQPEKYVRPRAEIYNLTWKPPTDAAGWKALAEQLELKRQPADAEQLGELLVEKYGIERSTDCAVCHR